MSTLAYAALTTRRDLATSGTRLSASPSDMKTYVDALAALVPAEVLTLHGLMLSATTTVMDDVTTITDPQTLARAFGGLAVVAAGLYVVPRLSAKTWDRLDFIRMFIPPLAFVGWTMLQRSTAFDAVLLVKHHPLADGARTVAALFLAVFLAVTATALAYQADRRSPPGPVSP